MQTAQMQARMQEKLSGCAHGCAGCCLDIVHHGCAVQAKCASKLLPHQKLLLFQKTCASVVVFVSRCVCVLSCVGVLWCVYAYGWLNMQTHRNVPSRRFKLSICRRIWRKTPPIVTVQRHVQTPPFATTATWTSARSRRQ